MPGATAVPWKNGNTPDGTCSGSGGYTCDVLLGNCCGADGVCGSDEEACGHGWRLVRKRLFDFGQPCGFLPLANLGSGNVLNGTLIYLIHSSSRCCCLRPIGIRRVGCLYMSNVSAVPQGCQVEWGILEGSQVEI
ncbi:hypothetical protein LX32DRAFT_193858 [Colletotrichum zoysiae]|uniref:Chitin-binding type-1 domain-containing protein n=1 Tax=Colletotrichum zoysiae TaxID=1216348 RepID=A0AAD9H5Y0_9PEZI|nr:hypothetical protein LX32DRAFT_193858 [Colletotrichum zoysiae]